MHQDRKAVVSGILRWLVPLLISAVTVIFLSQKVDLRAVGQAFQKISLNTILLIVLLYFSGHLLRVLCWYVILDGKFPFKMVFYGMSAGYLLNNVLPLRLGEFGRALLLSGKGKDHAGFMEVFASIITERMLDVFLAAFFFLLTLSLIVGQNSLRVAAIVIFILIVVIMVAAAIAAAHKEKILASLETRWADKPKRLEKALPKIEEFLTGFRFLLKPKQLILALALLAGSWAFCIGEFTVLQQELLSSSRWWWGAFVASAGAFASALPSAPAGLGVFEAATVSAYTLLGTDQSTALVIALILHAIQFVAQCLLGMIGLYLLGENLGNLFRKASLQKTQK